MPELLIYTNNGVYTESISNVLTSKLTDSLDGIYTFDFSLLASRSENIKKGYFAYLMDGEVYNQFKITKIQRSYQSEIAIVSVSCEHLSYKLNDDYYALETFSYSGTAAGCLAELLSGTGFVAGRCDFTNTVEFAFISKTSRRKALMDFAAYLGGDIEYNNNSIGILSHRGSAERKNLSDMGNACITSLSSNEDESSTKPNISLALKKGAEIATGDEVTVTFNPLGISVDSRIVSVSRNPFSGGEISADVGTYKPTYEKSQITNQNDTDTKIGEIEDTVSDLVAGGVTIPSNMVVTGNTITATYVIYPSGTQTTSTFTYVLDNEGRISSISSYEA